MIAILLALALPARAGELPRQLGMYPTQGPSLAMLDSKIVLRARGPIVEGTVAQTFRNETERATEATYIFPLPADAAVSAMAIDIGSRTIRAQIARRDEAQRAYEDAVSAGLGAGLLDQERPDVFTQTVSAIPPHGTVTVTLRFDTTARYQAGTWELALPLVVAPRYAPGTASGRPTTGTGRSPDSDRSPDASRVTPAGAPGAGGATEVTLELADATDVASPTHEVTRNARGYAFVDPHSDHDAIVRWKAPIAAWTEQADDGGYAAVLAEAPPAAARTVAVRLALVVDRSASMSGDADAVEHPLVRALVAALTAKDDVAITGGLELEHRAPDQLVRAIDGAWPKPSGAFDLTRVLASLRGRGAPVVLVSDGLVTDDRAALHAAAQIGAPVYVVGVGPAPNRSLLARLASSTGGTARFAVNGDDLDVLARDVLADVAMPPAPLAVTWGTLAASEVVPATLPRLGAGQAALVLARIKRVQPANARVRGDLIGFTAVTPPRAPAGATSTRGALGRRWARLELDELVAAGSSAAITEHALRYGLVSPTTSMIAVGADTVVTGGVKHSTAVPVSVPAGMHWQLVKHAFKTPAPEHVRKDDEELVNERPRHKDKGGAEEREVTDKNETKKSRPKAHERTEDEDATADDDRDARPKKHAEQAGTTGPAPAAPPVAAAPEPLPDAGGEIENVSEKASYEAPRRRVRYGFAAGLGIVASRGSASALSELTARIETGRRTTIGLEGSLWLVGGLHLEGNVLATILQRGLGRVLEVGGGAGLHLGSGAGPAFELTLRAQLPIPRLRTFLRYDGALLYHDGTKDGEHAGTFGFEADF